MILDLTYVSVDRPFATVRRLLSPNTKAFVRRTTGALLISKTKVLLLLGCLLLENLGCSRHKDDLYAVCQEGKVKALLEILREDPTLVNRQKEPDLKTPLHVSADFKQYDVTEWLIAKGANVNARTLYGETALHLAAFRVDVETCRLLLKNGADVNASICYPSKSTLLTTLSMRVRISSLKGQDLEICYARSIWRKVRQKCTRKTWRCKKLWTCSRSMAANADPSCRRTEVAKWWVMHGLA